MGNWYLVRHGETDWNKTGRTQGHLDVPLNATGRRQAELLAKGLDGVEFAGIYSSDLARTYESAQLITAGRDLEIATDPDLREFAYGTWEGLTMAEIEARHPGALAERIDAGNQDFAAPGGENTAQVSGSRAALLRTRGDAPRLARQRPRGCPRRIDSRPGGVFAGLGGRRLLELSGRLHRAGRHQRSFRKPRPRTLE